MQNLLIGHNSAGNVPYKTDLNCHFQMNRPSPNKPPLPQKMPRTRSAGPKTHDAATPPRRGYSNIHGSTSNETSGGGKKAWDNRNFKFGRKVDDNLPENDSSEEKKPQSRLPALRFDSMLTPQDMEDEVHVSFSNDAESSTDQHTTDTRRSSLLNKSMSMSRMPTAKELLGPHATFAADVKDSENEETTPIRGMTRSTSMSAKETLRSLKRSPSEGPPSLTRQRSTTNVAKTPIVSKEKARPEWERPWRRAMKKTTSINALKVKKKPEKEVPIIPLPDRMESEVQSINKELEALRKENESLNMDRNYLSQEKDGLKEKLDVALSEKNALYGKANESMHALTENLLRVQGELSKTRESKESLEKRMEILVRRVAFLSEAREKKVETEKAPKGTVALIFTDVEQSTRLWETNPQMMEKALTIQNEAVRALIEKYGGYEVKTEGDAFMVAFSNGISALDFCLAVQLGLLEAEWPKELYDIEFGSIKHDSEDGCIYRGLRVRMGGHIGEPICKLDEITHRMDYFGPMVNKSARVGGLAAGGQICVSKELGSLALDADNQLMMINSFLSHDHGGFALKGIDGETEVVELLPTALKGRGFKEVQNKAQPAQMGFDAKREMEQLKAERDQWKQCAFVRQSHIYITQGREKRS